MKTCPKCAFVQPPDRFCANCGVDMNAYNPPKPPFFRRLTNNIYLQLLAIALLVFFGIHYILENKDGEIFEPPPEVEQYQEASYQEPPTPPARVEPPAVQKMAMADTTAGEAASLTAAPKGGTLTENVVAETVDTSPKIHLRFAMLSSEQLESVLENSAQRNDLGGGAASGILRTARFKFSAEQDLGRSPAKKLTAQQDLTFDGTAKKAAGSQQFLGLVTRVLPVAVGLNGLQLNVEIGTNFLHPDIEESGPELRVINTSFQFRPGEIPYVLGALPHRMPRIAATDAFFTRGPFAVYGQEEFLEGQAEFIILFHVEGLKEN